MNRVRNLATGWTWGHTALTAALTITLFRLLMPVREPDIYWHLLLGRAIVTDGNLSGDPSFTFGPHQDWISTQSVSEALAYLYFQFAGWGGFVFLRAFGGFLVAAAVAWAIYRLLPRTLGTSFRLWVTAVATFLAVQYPSVQERPQTATFILLPVFGFFLIRMIYTGRTPNLLATFLVVMGWTWLHGGSMLVGPMLLAGWVLRLVARRMGWLGSAGYDDGFLWRGPAVAAAAVLGTLVNPIGWRIYEQGAAITASASVGIVEWATPWPVYPVMYTAMPLLLALWGLAAYLLARCSSFPRRVFIVDALLLVPFVLYSETANRVVPIAVLITIPLVARRWAQALAVVWHRPLPRLVPRAALPIALMLCTVTLGAVAYSSINAAPVGDESPRRIFSGLADTSGERRVIGSYNITGRLQLLTQPEVRTGLDGRADRYSPEQLRSYIKMLRGEDGWLQTLQTGYAGATDYIDMAHSGVVPKLKDMGWRVVCEEDTTDGRYVWLTAPGVSGACPSEPGELTTNIDR